MSRRRFLSWDCANKSLAWSFLEIDTRIYSRLWLLYDDLVNLIDTQMGAGYSMQMAKGACTQKIRYDDEFIGLLRGILDSMIYFTDQFVVYLDLGVQDILNGKKVSDTTEIERTRALRDFLVKIPPGQFTTIIEHQPNRIGTKTNNKSSAVSYQLALYYIDSDPVFIDPKLKNNIALHPDLELAKITGGSKYLIRKTHSKKNFLYLLDVFGLRHLIKGIPNNVLDDLADSTMQIFAYSLKNKLFA
jgi:hypothetical protein